MPKLTNRQIENGYVTIAQLAKYEILDQGKTNYNIGRTFDYLERAYEKIKTERRRLWKAHFGEKNADETHPRWREFDEALDKFLSEETEVEKVFKINREGLATKKDTPSVPGRFMSAISFMIEDYDTNGE